MRFKMDNTCTPLGEDEDEWDDIIARESSGSVSSDTGNGMVEKRISWAHEFKNLAQGFTQKLQVEGRASALLSQEMLEVVHKERDLARKEQRRARKARRYTRKQEVGSSNEQALLSSAGGGDAKQKFGT